MASPEPAMSGNHSRSSSVGAVQMRSMSCIMREAERIRVDAAEAPVVEARLADDVGVGLQEFQERPFADLAALVQPLHDPVMAIGGAALVHHLGLRLRIEILRDQADDAQDLALPGLQARRGLLEEIEDVLLRQLEQGAAPFVVKAGFALAFLARHGAPQVVVGPLRLEQALALAPLLRGEVRNLLARVAVDAVAASGHAPRRARARPRPGRSAPRIR